MAVTAEPKSLYCSQSNRKSVEPSLWPGYCQKQQVVRILRFFTLTKPRWMSQVPFPPPNPKKRLSSVAPAVLHLCRSHSRVLVKCQHCFSKALLSGQHPAMVPRKVSAYHFTCVWLQRLWPLVWVSSSPYIFEHTLILYTRTGALILCNLIYMFLNHINHVLGFCLFTSLCISRAKHISAYECVCLILHRGLESTHCCMLTCVLHARTRVVMVKFRFDQWSLVTAKCPITSYY